MRKLFLLMVSGLLTLALAAGEAWSIDSQQASLSERINLTIPQRVALHLTEDEWIVDLNNPMPGENGEGCYLVPKGYQGTLQDAIAAALGDHFKPIDTYPAIKDLNGNGKIDEGEKGTIICLNQKVLQKFCNNGDGCELDLKVTRTLGGSHYGLSGVVENAPDLQYTKFVQFNGADDGTPLELLKVLGQRLPGWLDDLIIEAFWFDGSEVAGTYEFNFLFQLAAL
ncbi:hypothetical protein KQ693_11765 [Thermus sp. PS18]|uniref:hypothetical protein n=1 Tax=Thermus sp. PS18 TaxID=2849039 RepID=UPI002264F19A|nr:hypothetical protein [Thermus sp. PS18]UZX15286.1 hypothetical protein KQ693_11765 [Thermus sp. PS18]